MSIAGRNCGALPVSLLRAILHKIEEASEDDIDGDDFDDSSTVASDNSFDDLDEHKAGWRKA